MDPISIRLDAEVKTKLEELAKADSRSLSAYINLVLKKHLDGQPNGYSPDGQGTRPAPKSRSAHRAK